MGNNVIGLRRDWAAIGLLFLANAILLLITDFSLLWRPELVILAAAAFLQILGWIYSSLRDAPRLAGMAITGSLLLLFTNGVAVLNYILCGTAVLPLWDAQFAAADNVLGLNWLGFFHWMTAHRGVFFVNNIIYAALGPELIFLIIWLETTGRHAGAISFWRQFAITAAITVGCGILLPAAGPFAFYHLQVAQHTGYVQQFAALRAGTLRRIDLGHAEGLVSFPSFHTTLALLCAYAARVSKYLAPPLLLLNLAVIFSAPVIGGHYFVDILAGALVAILIIAAEQSRLRKPGVSRAG